MSNSLLQSLIFGKYRILELLGKGSSSTVYMGKNINLGENVAIKVEEWKKQGNLLEGEAYNLFKLKGNGVPEVKSFGRHGKYKILVLTLLGNSIDKYFKSMDKNFSIKDISMIAIQLIERLEYIHSKNIIHRDIKPDNLLEDIKTKRLLYLIDFGLAKKYRSSRTGKHIKFSIPKKLTGTARFASTNALRGAEQSRRDDMESAGYFLIYLAKKGFLPWQSIKIKDKMERYKQIYLLKKNIEPEKLCSDLPNEFSQYIKYARELKFEENPNYNYMKGLFINILTKLGYKNDLFFSWLTNEKKYIDPNMLKVNENKKRRVSPQTRIIQKLRMGNKSKEKGKQKDIFNDNKTLNNKSEITSEKSESQLFNFNSSSNLKDNKLLNFKPKTGQQLQNKNYSERKLYRIFKTNLELNKVKGKAIMNNKKTVNSEIESKPIFFDPENGSFNTPNSELNTQNKGKIIPKNINNLRSQQYLKKNINQNNRIKTQISTSSKKNLNKKKIKSINNQNQNKKKITNNKANNSTKKILNQKLSNKDLNSISRNGFKKIKFNKGNLSEFNSFINNPGKLNKKLQNINNKNHFNQMNDFFFKNHSLKKYYISNSEMTNFTTNKIMDYNSNKRYILNVNNNSKKNARDTNGFEIYNNSIGNNRNTYSLLDNKSSEFSSNSLSFAFDHIIYRNNPKYSLYKNHSKKNSFNSYKDYRNIQNWSESFTYQSPQILKDLKKSEAQKEINCRKINLNINNNNHNIKKCIYNYSNIDNKINNYSSKRNGSLNLYQYNNYIIKYNINMNKDKQLISQDISNNSNYKCSSISKSSRINKSNDYKIYKRLYSNNKLINGNNESKFLYQASSSKFNKNLINHNNI